MNTGTTRSAFGSNSAIVIENKTNNGLVKITFTDLACESLDQNEAVNIINHLVKAFDLRAPAPTKPVRNDFKNPVKLALLELLDLQKELVA